jgi:hypothetical protein
MSEMRTKKKVRPREINPIQHLILHVHCMHKVFDYSYLDTLNVSELLHLAHPNYRQYHREQIYG